MNEASFWSQRVRRLLPSDTFAKRVENGLEAGTPDVFYCWNGRRGWIENKFRERPPAYPDTLVFPRALRAEQRAWWIPYLRAGGYGLVVAGVGSQSFAWVATEELIRDFNLLTWRAINDRAIRLTAETFPGLL